MRSSRSCLAINIGPLGTTLGCVRQPLTNRYERIFLCQQLILVREKSAQIDRSAVPDRTFDVIIMQYRHIIKRRITGAVS